MEVFRSLAQVSYSPVALLGDVAPRLIATAVPFDVLVLYYFCILDFMYIFVSHKPKCRDIKQTVRDAMCHHVNDTIKVTSRSHM